MPSHGVHHAARKARPIASHARASRGWRKGSSLETSIWCVRPLLLRRPLALLPPLAGVRPSVVGCCQALLLP
eukprot:scaffold16967_cov113-Isochrysis_galbana.AAC.2